MSYRYSLKQEISQNKIISIVYLFIMALLIGVPFFFKNFYTITPSSATYTAFFELGFFVLPILSSFTILKILSAIYENNTYEFIQSAPLSFFRLCFLRFIQLLIPMYILFLLFIYSGWQDVNKVLVQAIDYTLYKLIYFMSVNFVFIVSISLLLITISKSMFYSSMIIISYLLFDYFLLPNSSAKICLTVTKISYNKTNQILENRNIYFFLSVISLLIVILFCVIKDNRQRLPK